MCVFCMHGHYECMKLSKLRPVEAPWTQIVRFENVSSAGLDPIHAKLFSYRYMLKLKDENVAAVAFIANFFPPEILPEHRRMPASPPVLDSRRSHDGPILCPCASYMTDTIMRHAEGYKTISNQSTLDPV